MAVEAARARLREVGQSHLVEHAQTLGEAAANAFLVEAARHPWGALTEALRTPGPGVTPSLRPPHALTWKRQMNEGGIRRQLGTLGRALIQNGRVATLLLAGGQGTRLGLDGPKGNFVFGPEPDRTLFRILAERVAAAGRGAKRPPPFYILVSEATEEATRAAFADPSRFGLAEGQVRIIRQGTLPVLDADGRAVLEAPGRLATAPDGHGGAIDALAREGVIEQLREDGVDVLTTFQVDNPLGLPLDPVMLGWMVERRAVAGGKAIRRLPEEKVGVYARDIQGKHLVVEYSEFPDGGMPDDLVMGSIALHAFGVEWLSDLLRAGVELPYHLAHKKVPYLAEDGTTQKPDEPNAYKFEKFIFDVIPHADRVEVHEVAREREFAPVKNAEGADSPATARTLVDAEVRRQIEAAGKAVKEPISLRPLHLEP